MRFLPPKTHTTHTRKPRHPAGLLGVFPVGRDDPARLGVSSRQPREQRRGDDRQQTRHDDSQ